MTTPVDTRPMGQGGLKTTLPLIHEWEAYKSRDPSLRHAGFLPLTSGRRACAPSPLVTGRGRAAGERRPAFWHRGTGQSKTWCRAPGGPGRRGGEGPRGAPGATRVALCSRRRHPPSGGPGPASPRPGRDPELPRAPGPRRRLHDQRLREEGHQRLRTGSVPCPHVTHGVVRWSGAHSDASVPWWTVPIQATPPPPPPPSQRAPSAPPPPALPTCALSPPPPRPFQRAPSAPPPPRPFQRAPSVPTPPPPRPCDPWSERARGH